MIPKDTEGFIEDESGNAFVKAEAHDPRADSDYVDQRATKTVTDMVSPATAEPGDDFWTVTVRHSYVK